MKKIFSFIKNVIRHKQTCSLPASVTFAKFDAYWSDLETRKKS